MADGAKVVAGMIGGLRVAASLIGGVVRFAVHDAEGGQLIEGQLDDEGRLDIRLLDLLDGEWVQRFSATNETFCSVEAVHSAPVESAPVRRLPIKRLPAKCLPAPVVDAASGDGWAA